MWNNHAAVYIVMQHKYPSSTSLSMLSILPEHLGYSWISYHCPWRVSDGLLNFDCPRILSWICWTTSSMLDHSPIIKVNLPLTHALMNGVVSACLYKISTHTSTTNEHLYSYGIYTVYSSMAESRSDCPKSKETVTSTRAWSRNFMQKQKHKSGRGRAS